MQDRELVDALAQVWASTAAVGEQLTEAQWKAPSELPGWSNQDVLAHLIGIEEMSLGRPGPEVEVPDYPHLKNDFARANERWIEALRPESGAEVLARFRAVTDERLAGLRALDADGFGADSWTPSGPGTVRDLLPFRIFDSWVHEQDVRLAVGIPGNLDSPGAALTLERCRNTMGYVVGKKAGAPDGAAVTFALAPPIAGEFTVSVHDGRGRVDDGAPAEPTVRLATTGETYIRLACGRTTPERVEVDLDGDRELGEAVLANLNFLF